MAQYDVEDQGGKASIWQRLRTFPLRQKVRDLFFETKIEIIIGALTFGTIAGIATYNANKHKKGEIPVAFSEIESTIEKFKARGEQVPPLTMYYSVANDVPMKVFESNDLAYQNSDGSNAAFARELRTRIDPDYKQYALISEYAGEFPEYTRGALQSLRQPLDGAKQLESVRDAFNNAWAAQHHNHYHTQWYTTTECSGSGKSRSCHTVLRSRQVYDWTDHTYTYNSAEGERAFMLLAALVQKYPDMKLTEQLKLATETHADNEGAIKKSMKELFKKKNPKAEDYLELANKWATGSDFAKYYPAVRKAYDDMVKIKSSWGDKKSAAQSVSYRTYHRSDDGPEGYQIAQSALASSNEMIKNLNEIVEGINFSGQKVPELNAKIKQYVGVTLNGQKGDADQLRADIMDMSREIYKKNFSDGFDVDPTIWAWVVLFTVLGAGAGVAAGAAVDKALPGIDRRLKERWREKQAQQAEEKRLQAEQDQQARNAQKKDNEDFLRRHIGGGPSPNTM